MTSDRLAARLRATFLAELEELVRAMNADLLVLERHPGDAERLKSLFRVAHTLKGAARAANVPSVEQACHAVESLLAESREGKRVMDGPTIAQLFAAADALSDARLRLQEGRDLGDAPISSIGRVLAGTPAKGTQGSTTPVATPAPAPSERPEQATQIRIDAGALDALMAATADLRQASTRITTASRELRTVDDLMGQVAVRWRSAARQLRGRLANWDGVESELHLIEDLDDRLRALTRATSRAAAGTSRESQALTHAVDEVVGGAVRLRMRPFSEICEALPRMVRDVASAERKTVQLVIHGGAVEADRAVLDALREPIVQLVRNAVSHGVEEPARRAAAGKPAEATLTIAAALRGNRFVVSVADDGAGIDTSGLRRVLERAGRTVPADDAELARTLFEGGLTTRAEPGVISGRGVGLDAVRAAMHGIGGIARVEWTAGKGTTFTLDCPLTLASIRVVLVAVGAHTIAIPTANVERLLRVPAVAITRSEGRDVLPDPDGPVPIVSLARVLGPPYAERPVSEVSPAVQMSVGGRRLAAVVDGLLDECEITVRPLDHRGQFPLLTGAALISTGGVAPVVNVSAVIAEGTRRSLAGAATIRAESEQAVARRRILVVDDSITTRTLEQSVLEAAGFDVATAVDGADAWRTIQERPFDLVLSDVEMPRMDGFALCEAIRGSRRFARLPVVLVTALESPEQRARGLEAGADAYLGKSSFDQQTLLDVIRQFLE